MDIKIIIPDKGHSGYRIAGDIFNELYNRTTGKNASIITDAEEIQGTNLVIIGNDAVNKYLAGLFLDKKIDRLKIKYGTDDYQIVSYRLNGKNILVFAGGRPRAVIYSVYRYFELYTDCGYFWDGDIINKADNIIFEDIDLYESPRFEYRGLRYFAHRSLHRFQAEHWSLEDWKNEIDWVLKKRLNLFMLRIGMDDLFQKAFPDIVDYPLTDEKLPEAGPDHDDRTLFWPLEYRGELRKNILKYAFERDIYHPEDCGTMTHWYSRTPLKYLEKRKPEFLAQSTDIYNEQTGLVWDIKNDEYFEDYFKLTDTHIKNYGKAEIFHTIGLAERQFTQDREANNRLKQYVYHKISSYLKEKYPSAPLLIASWDFFYTYKSDEVRAVINQLDPNQAIVFDYTSDSESESYYGNWEVENKFPWIFGIFQAYQPNNEIRGNYELIDTRIKAVASDEKCIGMVFWPELSHGDTFMLEYFSANAWDPEKASLDDQLEYFCNKRYGDNKDTLFNIWKSFLPVAGLHAWNSSGDSKIKTDLFFNILDLHIYCPDNADSKYDETIESADLLNETAAGILKTLSELADIDNEFIRRDIIDIARTVCGRYISLELQRIYKIYTAWRKDGQIDIDILKNYFKSAAVLLDGLYDLLSCSDEFTLYSSFNRLSDVHYVNPLFEQTLKNNASGAYCRSYICENIKYLYLPELEALSDLISKNISENQRNLPDKTLLNEKKKAIKDVYNSIPLFDMQNKRDLSLKQILLDIYTQIKK